MVYRIQRRKEILHSDIQVEVNYTFAIQKKCLWFWLDMHFDDYPTSIMLFDTRPEAVEYLKDIIIARKLQ